MENYEKPFTKFKWYLTHVDPHAFVVEGELNMAGTTLKLLTSPVVILSTQNYH